MYASSNTHHDARAGPHREANASAPQSGSLAPEHTLDLPPHDPHSRSQSPKPFPSLPSVASSSENLTYRTTPIPRSRKTKPLSKPLLEPRAFTERRPSIRSAPQSPVLGSQQPEPPARSCSFSL
uniref:Uncharacterized protein n=1 Tax=Moniliophthora roreri TaxID=221103 RepID=A0A0W0FSB3_MONRR